MSRLILLVLIVGLLKNEVECGTLGKISKTEGSLMPRAREALPSNATRLNLELSSLNEFLANASSRNDRPENATSSRQGKVFPKFAFLAGLNIGGSVSAAPPSLASLAKISEASPSASVAGMSPYIAAMFDPYPYGPSPHAVQQSIASLHRLLDRIQAQLDNSNVTHNSSSPQIQTTPKVLMIPENHDFEILDARKRQKDKLKKAQRVAEKRRKLEKKKKEELEELLYDDYAEDEENEVIPKPARVPAAKKKIVTKQAAVDEETTKKPTTTTTEQMVTTTVMPMENETDNGNTTNPYNPGYYGGNPQQIGNVGLTYNTAQNAYTPAPYVYGPPANSYGPPANNYGPPANSYGPPANNYGPPTNNYGPPTNNNGLPTNNNGLPINSYGTPSNSYGTPSNSYGTPSNSYGTPSNSYGTPSNSYGIPAFATVSPPLANNPTSFTNPQSPFSNGPSTFANSPSAFANGPSTFAIAPLLFTNGQTPFAGGSSLYPNGPSPSLSYATPQYSSAQDQEPVYFEDPTGNSFISPERWAQYPPFARSLKLELSTRSPIRANRNGFVPILARSQ